MTGVYSAVGCTGGRAVNGDWSGGLEGREVQDRFRQKCSKFRRKGDRVGMWSADAGACEGLQGVFVGQGDRGGGVEN